MSGYYFILFYLTYTISTLTNPHVVVTSTPYMTLRSSRRRLNPSDSENSEAQQDTPSTLSLRFV